MPAEILAIPVLSVLVLTFALISAWKADSFDPEKHFFGSKINHLLQSISAKLVTYIRLYVYILFGIWGVIAAAFSYFTSVDSTSFMKSLTQIYAFTALFLLFLTLTPGLIRAYYPHFILDSLLIKARRAFGLMTFVFGFLHGFLAFDVYFSFSLSKVPALSVPYQVALYFAFAALFIFFLQAITSFDKAVEIMTYPKWKILHRFVYPAFLLSVLHGFIRGTHFNGTYKTFLQIMVFITLTFILLEIGATMAYVLIRDPRKTLLKSTLIFGVLGIIGISAFYLSILKLSQLN